MLSCAPAALHAEPSLSELAAEIQALKSENQEMKAQNRQMRAAISDLRGETRKTSAKVRVVAERGPPPAYALPPPGPAYPVGVVPAFVTADKKLLFGAITITPGGFLAADSVFRTRTTQGDATAYSAIPTQNSPLAGTNELRLTARQSRVALLAEGAISPTMLAAGYAELDFLGAAHTANNVESDSYNPRIRNLYATLDMTEYGLHVLAGQSWTLATLNSKGITPRNEVIPPTIEPQFVPGFVWSRQPQIRLTKDFDKKLWLSLSAEEPQTSYGASPACNSATTIGVAAVTGITCGAFPQGGGGFLDTTTFYTLNHVPDVIGKVAYEAHIADRDVHIEAFGMYRDFYDRVAYANGNNLNQNTPGYGAGGGLIAPLLPRRLDFQLSGLVGRGIGRYGTSTLPDATFQANGAPRAIPEAILLAGLTLHATPSIDVYTFGGFERQMATYFLNDAGTAVGVGGPAVNDSGCYTEGSALCTGATKAVWQVTAGMWDKIYKGNFGEVRAGLQYSYTKRELFASAFGGTAFAPKTDENIFLTSLRYFPFQ